ncbi:MAG: alpha-galactosidase, partial [Prevotella sp.]|nr:alpha-galactosidase [Prevotella sp.]
MTIRNLILFSLLTLVMTVEVQAQRRTPVMGWSSWNTYRVHISDTLIKKQADAIVQKGLKDVGYTYINVDDGFFGRRNAQGEMQPHPQRFPRGMKAVADYIHSLGLKAGIYSDAGAVTCGSIWDKDSIGIGAGLYGHEEQ